MANTVLAQILRRNNYDYDCVHKESILCGESVTEGLYWRIPLVSNGVFTGYQYRMSESKPTDDSVKAIRVRDRKNNITYYVAIADGDTETAFTELCNACCDGDTEMDTVALPDVIIEEEGCANADGDFDYFTIAPEAIEASERYYLSGSANGSALPAAPAIGFVDLAALATWADANWNTGGLSGVTVDGGKVTLHGDDTILTAGIHITVERYFESNAPGALTLGQHYVVNATVNGNVLPTIEGVEDAALSTIPALLNADASYASYGEWGTTGGKITLRGNAVTASIVVTKAP